MMKSIVLTTFFAAVALLAFHPSIEMDPVEQSVTVTLTLMPEAAAQNRRADYRRQGRRVARRTARRTTRRQNYYNSLPGGCVQRGSHYYCGGVYYQPVVQGGRTVYIIVNP